jgi:hypothetical protein
MQNGAEQGENPVHGNAEQTEGEQQKPDEGVEDQGEQGQGPAEKKDEEPDQQAYHGETSSDFVVIIPYMTEKGENWFP